MNIRPQNLPRYEQAEKLYKQGKSLREIGRELKMDYRYISRYLKEKGYVITRNQHWIKNDEHILQQSIDLYKKGYNIKTISNMLKVKDNRISEYLQKQGILLILNNQLHDYNEDIFSSIDTEEKAYWLGFISADGSVTNNVLELTLSEKDKEHVESFARFISPTAKIKYRPSTKSYRVSICNKKICDDLFLLGVTPNKSLTLQFCEQIPKNLIHHYIRGYVDGDGSIGQRKDGQSILEILGTESFLDTIIYKLGWDHNKKARHGEAYSIRYSGNRKVPKMLNQLYQEATVYLPRKYDKYQQIISYCRSRQK